MPWDACFRHGSGYASRSHAKITLLTFFLLMANRLWQSSFEYSTSFATTWHQLYTLFKFNRQRGRVKKVRRKQKPTAARWFRVRHHNKNYTANHKPRSAQPFRKKNQQVPKPIGVWIIPAMIWHVRTSPINWEQTLCGALLAKKVLQRCVHLSELQKFVVDQRERCHNADKHSNEGSSRFWNCSTVRWKGQHDDGARRIVQPSGASTTGW